MGSNEMDGITTSINAILKNLIKNFNTLLDCPVRFAGEYDKQKIHNFIEYIEYYKRIKCIGDEQALQELQYLLLDHAHNWWLRRKVNLNTWSEALSVLENQYSKKRPKHVIYTEILKQRYSDYECKDNFIDDKIELFDELSQPELREENKLEIIYALLPIDIQNKVKFVNLNNIKDLKEQLKLIKLNNATIPLRNGTNEPTAVITDKEATEVQNLKNTPVPNNHNTTVSIAESNKETEKEPIIKVRKTQDLMPQDIKEEDQETSIEQTLVVSNNNNLITNSHNKEQTNQDDFQIDSDIMNQINNIIDESEMNMRAFNKNENLLHLNTQITNGVPTIELLGFDIQMTRQPELAENKTSSQQEKSSLKTTKKNKVRCSYCRHFNHTAQVCFKKAKHMKLYPERFLTTTLTTLTTTLKENNNETIDQNNETVLENMTLNCTTGSTTTTPSDTLTTESVITTPNILNPILTTSLPSTPIIANSPIVTSSPSVILNNSTEKCINSSLTTKLIAPINGKTSNKILAAKLRSANSPSPKCHQCGTVGFYKSICPNCSPIYNNSNNNIHNQYSK